MQRKRNGRVDRYYLWDGDQLLAELDSLAKRVAEYVYQPGIDRPLALVTTRANGTTLVRAFAQDELGNVIGVLDPALGTIDQAISYDPWGKPSVTGTLSDSSALMWKGLLWQGGIVGLSYMRNRWYDPDIGRFMTEDPIGIAGGINKYVFARNDPINGHDPSGLVEEPPDDCGPLSFSSICSDWWMYESANFEAAQRRLAQQDASDIANALVTLLLTAAGGTHGGSAIVAVWEPGTPISAAGRDFEVLRRTTVTARVDSDNTRYLHLSGLVRTNYGILPFKISEVRYNATSGKGNGWAYGPFWATADATTFSFDATGEFSWMICSFGLVCIWWGP